MATESISADFPYTSHYVDVPRLTDPLHRRRIGRSDSVSARQPDFVVSVAQYYPARPAVRPLHCDGSDRDGQIGQA